MKKYAIVPLVVVFLVIVILVIDAILPSLGWPTISASVVYWTSATPLVPMLLGFCLGLLMMHLFERYFITDPEFHWWPTGTSIPPVNQANVLFTDGRRVWDSWTFQAGFRPTHWGYRMRLP
jgi:hypothetical protein